MSVLKGAPGNLLYFLVVETTGLQYLIANEPSVVVPIRLSVCNTHP